MLLAIAIFLNGILGDVRGLRADLTEDEQFIYRAELDDVRSRHDDHDDRTTSRRPRPGMCRRGAAR